MSASNTPADEVGPEPPSAHPLLMSIRHLSRLLTRSVPSLRRDDTAGRLPTAVWIGGSKKWRRDEILAWVAAGCPDRTTWTVTATNPTRS